MANAKIAWGIDIGNRALKAVQLGRAENHLRVEDIDVIEHEQILSSAGDNKESMIQTAIAHFVERHNVKNIPIAISVSGQSSFARFIKLPPVEPKKVPEIIKFEAIQQIPFPLDEVEWAYQLFETPDSPDIEVGIFAMRRELVNRQISYFKDAGMTVRVVQMSPLAVYNAMYYDQRVQNGTTMIVDVGAENTDLIIADGETVWLRTLPIGGNNFTESLAKAFKVNFAKAEDLKRSASTSRYARQIFQAMRPIFGDLVAEIQRSIGFYASVHRESRIKKIVALGGTFRLPTLQKYLQQNLQLDVERLDGLTAGAPEDGRLATILNDNLISMVGAYGLAVQAMGDAKISSSLLPEQIRRERVWKEKTKWFSTAAALFVIGAAGIGAKWYVENNKYDEEAATRQQVDSAASAAKQMDNQWKQISSPSDVDKRITNMEALPKYRNLWPSLLNDIANRTPQMPGTREQILHTPRQQRRQMFINNITAVYVDSISPFLTMTEADFIHNGGAQLSGHTVTLMNNFSQQPMYSAQQIAQGRGMSPAMVQSRMNEIRNNQKRGFLLDIHCTSPNGHNPGFVDDEFVKRLQLLNDVAAFGDGKPYYIGRATFLSARKMSEDPEFITRVSAYKQSALQGGVQQQPQQYVPGAAQGAQQPNSSSGGAGMYGPGRDMSEQVPGMPPAPAPATAPATPTGPQYDPVTGEDMSDDWEFEVLVAVVLDPEPPSNAPAVPHVTRAPIR